jgi:hypothetical protein
VDDREGAAPGDEPEGGRDQATKEGDGPGFSPPRKGEAVFFAEGIEERLPLLGVLNRIPGRDGRRWIALPFSFRSGGVDCKVSLRILLADTNGIPWRAERLALDVGTNRRRWSFMLENAPAGEGRLFARAVFGARPPLSARAERGLRELLGGIAEKLILRDSSGGAFPGEEGGEDQWNR